MKYKYIDAEKLIAEIEKRAKFHDDAMKACVGLNNIAITHSAGWKEDTELLAIITSLQQEQPEVGLEKLKNKAELIANEIMMGVQANKYHTCIYDKASNDFNHSHLLRAALKGIKVGLNAIKEGAK